MNWGESGNLDLLAASSLFKESLQGAKSVDSDGNSNRTQWFSSKGQIVQIVVAVIACIFGGINAWPKMQGNQYFSTGAVLFYLLIFLSLLSVWLLFRSRYKVAGAGRDRQRTPDEPLSEHPTVDWRRVALERDGVIADLSEQLDKTNQLKSVLDECRSNLSSYEQADRNLEDKRKRDEETLASAPIIRIEYSTHAGQFLTLTNDSLCDAGYLSFSPITWTEKRVLITPAVPRQLKAHQSEQCQVGIAINDHGGPSIGSLVEKEVPDATPMVTLSYTDSEGVKHFERDFTLIVQSGYRLVWQPGKVRLRD